VTRSTRALEKEETVERADENQFSLTFSDQLSNCRGTANQHQRRNRLERSKMN
jgi:hypothetical protein